MSFIIMYSRMMNCDGMIAFRVNIISGVAYDSEMEDAYINLRKANEGWEQLGTYYFSADTVRVVLTDECKLRSVTADAVKIVKR